MTMWKRDKEFRISHFRPKKAKIMIIIIKVTFINYFASSLERSRTYNWSCDQEVQCRVMSTLSCYYTCDMCWHYRTMCKRDMLSVRVFFPRFTNLIFATRWLNSDMWSSSFQIDFDVWSKFAWGFVSSINMICLSNFLPLWKHLALAPKQVSCGWFATAK